MYKRTVEEQGQPGSFKARSVHNFIMNLCSALAAYCVFENKPEPYLYIKDNTLQLFKYLLSRTHVKFCVNGNKLFSKSSSYLHKPQSRKLKAPALILISQQSQILNKNPDHTIVLEQINIP